MVEIGGQPILWHIMKIYSAYGVNDFIICGGYKAEVIRTSASTCIRRTYGRLEHVQSRRGNAIEPWTVTLIDTGESTMTGGRIKRVAEYIGDETFCCTYGDCLGDVDIGGLIRFHRDQGVLATLTAIQPPGRFGAVVLGTEETKITTFEEKPQGDGGWINGGFFVVEPQVLDYIPGDSTVWEREPLERLASEGALAAYKHRGYWQSMETLRDKMLLESEWESAKPPWKVW
jgi:glucose-1-phosphate cytidylyltransferase